MNQRQDPMRHIAELLETKSCVKQKTYRHLKKVFLELKTEAGKVIDMISKRIKHKDKDITLAVIPVSENEFHVKVAGDLLIFLLHTNIIMLEESHSLHKSIYVADNPMRKYLGQINVYNFMADSIKYNRLDDPGYLLARFFINFEKHFLVEGHNQLSYMNGEISRAPYSSADISIFIQLLISQAIDADLVTVPFESIRAITLNQKYERSQALGAGSKIGFQMAQQLDKLRG